MKSNIDYFFIVRFKINYILNYIVDKAIKYINSRRLIKILNLYTSSNKIINDLAKIFKNIDYIENVKYKYNIL